MEILSIIALDFSASVNALQFWDSIFVITTLIIDERDSDSFRRYGETIRYKYDGEGLAAFPVAFKGSRPAGAELANLIFIIAI